MITITAEQFRRLRWLPLANFPRAHDCAQTRQIDDQLIDAGLVIVDDSGILRPTPLGEHAIYTADVRLVSA